ncbi:Uma2 family endonuclease [Actinomadura roseirufa]|uniref:Uma2 family endonuclease n=1 Tax=Actinomadura roseirufa TaxID=2094049 RepID=UPI001041A975|nr:Uma2 family endonuclease [Actinomadura roseirufa]
MATPLPAEPMPDQDGFTVEDWLALPESRQRVELIDGSFVVSPLAATNHQICTSRLTRILVAAAPDHLEVTEGANVPCAGEGAIPDVVVGDADVMLAATVALDPAHIHLVAEVVSPGRKNRTRDYTDKPRMYAAAGIPMFLRIELTGAGAPCVEVLVLKGAEYVQHERVCAGRTLRLAEPFEVAFDPAVLTGPRRARG